MEGDAWRGAEMTIDELVEKYGRALEATALATAALVRAEDDRKLVRAEKMNAAKDVSDKKAESLAITTPEYKAALKAYHAALENAEMAKAAVEHLRVRFEAWRSKTSAQKARLQHG